MTNYWKELIAKEEADIDLGCTGIYKNPGLYKITGPKYVIPSCLKTGTFKGKTEIKDGKDYYKWSTTTHNDYQYDLCIRFCNTEMSSILISNIELLETPLFRYNEAIGHHPSMKIRLNNVNDSDIRMWSWLENTYPKTSAPYTTPQRGLGLLWAFDYGKDDYAILPVNGIFVQSYETIYRYDSYGLDIIANLKFDKMWVKKVK